MLVQKQHVEDVILSSNSLEMLVAVEQSTKLQMPLFDSAQESISPLPEGESLEPQAPIALPKMLAPQKPAKSPSSETLPFDFEKAESETRSEHTTSSHGRHKIHNNTNALETIGSFEREIYQLLLGVEHSTILSVLDNPQKRPLTLRLGTRDLTNRIYARRKQNDKELLARLNAADSVEALNVVKANERANIKKSIKRARKSLFGKYFIEMSEGNAHTHDAITYRIYLPIQVLIRQLANGCVNWRRGGNDSRLLVDINGDDISRPISCGSNESMKEDVGCGMHLNSSVVYEIDGSSQGAGA